METSGKCIFITGGAGFIGSEAVHQAINRGWVVVNIDKLTYSGNLASLEDIQDNPNYIFIRADIANKEAMGAAFVKYEPDYVLNLAAETHVDRSIDSPESFINTNIVGTYVLLEEARRYWKKISLKKENKGKNFRFIHISTDEVFGDLSDTEERFTETTAYKPSSPYSASKASSDHLVRAWQRTYGLPTLVTNCSNNFGPRQFPEKLIPLTILHALEGKTLPVYGKGTQIRDWLYVSDHVRALFLVLEKGEVGETYAIGGHGERRNIDIVHDVCSLLDELSPPNKTLGITSYRDLIKFVKDRPGHDVRYAINPEKITRTLGWQPIESVQSGLRKTVLWYLDNKKWWNSILSGQYHGERLGLSV